MWFGSLGFVHKGLDLVLEAFRDLPDLQLTVCGPIDTEPEFVAAFRQELFETPNIETRGWIDIASREFVELANQTAAVVFPSCSEGGGGGVITCMHAAMLPVVTPEASVDVEDFGVVIDDASVAGVKDALLSVSRMSAEELTARTRRAYELVRSQHTRESFAKTYRQVVRRILSDSSSR